MRNMKGTSSRDTEKKIREIIFKFLSPKDYRLFIFGSRITGKAGKFSDYDIGIQGKGSLSFGTLALIREALEDSDLPVRVDMVDFSSVSPEFKKVALSKVKQL